MEENFHSLQFQILLNSFARRVHTFYNQHIHVYIQMYTQTHIEKKNHTNNRRPQSKGNDIGSFLKPDYKNLYCTIYFSYTQYVHSDARKKSGKIHKFFKISKIISFFINYTRSPLHEDSRNRPSFPYLQAPVFLRHLEPRPLVRPQRRTQVSSVFTLCLSMQINPPSLLD